MQFTYSLTEAEFVEYFELVRPMRDTRRRVRLLSLFAAAMSLILAYGFGPETRLFFTFLAIFLLLFSFLVLFTSGKAVKRMFRNNPVLSAEKRVDFGLEKITSDSASQHHEVKWSSFIRVEETRSLFVLFMSQNMGTPVPKRIFSADQLAKFRSLLTEKIPSPRENDTASSQT